MFTSLIVRASSRLAVLLATLSLLFATSIQALPIVDGFASAGEYSNMTSVQWYNNHNVGGTQFPSGGGQMTAVYYDWDTTDNLYLYLEHVTAMQIVLEQAKQFAKEILAVNAPLKAGFWFNLMQSGQVTQEHTHDDDDECLSGVYYIDTPADCGNLLITTPLEEVRISPQAGQFVFFPPNVPHQVTENKSKFERLSVGMNFGLKQD